MHTHRNPLMLIYTVYDPRRAEKKYLDYEYCLILFRCRSAILVEVFYERMFIKAGYWK